MHELLARHAFLRELVTSTLIGLGVYAGSALLIVAVELRRGSDMSVYRTPNALNDLAYAIFYQCSIYNLLVSPLFAVLSPRLGFLRVGLLLHLPPVVALIVCWIIFDFLNYWMHRLQHAVRPLWAFHSVHHAQTRLTFLTVFSETVQHSRLTWSYGPMRRLLVSPAFHATHHSVDERQYNGNYGRILSLWDVLFGTFVPADQPARFGVDGMDVPETLSAQFTHPFRYLATTGAVIGDS